MHVLLDSNVYISGLTFGGTPFAAMSLAHTRYKALTSSYIMEEIRKSLSSRKFNWAENKIDDALHKLFLQATLVESGLMVDATLRDPKDIPILACAIAGGADYIVTGDKDLLILKRYGQIRVITPKQFVDMM